MLKTSSLAKIRVPVSDLDKLKTMISVYGVDVGNDCDFFFFYQLQCEVDFLVIHGVFECSSFKLKDRLEMTR